MSFFFSSLRTQGGAITKSRPEAFFEKILSFSHRGTNDKAKTAPSSQKRINRNEVVPTLDPPPQPWATSETQWNFLGAKTYSNWNVPEDTNMPTDTPPAYSDVLNDNTPETIAVDHPDEHVQICPHEILTLTRRLRIINLPRFRYNGAKIDALTPESEFHHRGHDRETKECQDSCKPLGIIKDSSFVGSLKGFGTYSYQTPPPAGSIGGLALSFYWDMKCLDPKQVTYRTTIELQSFLKTSGISLCPHKKLSDIDIVNALHPIINRGGKPADPIDRYLVKQGIDDCAVCGTKIKISLREDGKRGRTCQVNTKRWLGGSEASDEHWRNQCVKPLKRHTSGTPDRV